MKIEQKLVLRKEALADLSMGDLRLVAGAVSGLSDCSLPSRECVSDVTCACVETRLTCHCP